MNTANPSLHPTCYSGLRPLLQAAELERWTCPARAPGDDTPRVR
jgi:hypothetical protein